jgi:hypothetical protein
VEYWKKCKNRDSEKWGISNFVEVHVTDIHGTATVAPPGAAAALEETAKRNWLEGKAMGRKEVQKAQRAEGSDRILRYGNTTKFGWGLLAPKSLPPM